MHEEINWHALTNDDTLAKLQTDAQGLSDSVAGDRLKQYGENILEEGKKVTAWDIFLAQIKNFFNYILYGAAALCLLAGEHRDFIFILIILAVNIALSFFQEYKAHCIVSGLKNLLVAKVNLLRGGHPCEVDAQKVVPGDILLLEEGMKIPADARLLKASALSIDEAMLTGESLPSDKTILPVKIDAPLGDRTNMVFSGTTVTRGTGIAIACSTGMKTELGKIAQALNETETPKTSFEIELEKLSKQITFVVGILVVVVAGILYVNGGKDPSTNDLSEIAIFCLALGVAAIPECMPMVLSFALAMGAQVMAGKKALVRRLAIVESCGSVDVICTDKTGTLTKNEMTVRQLFVSAHDPYYVTGEGYDAKSGRIQTRNVGGARLRLPLISGMLCNDSKRVFKEGKIEYYGDPTEIALRVVGEKGGYDSDDIARQYPRLHDVPFTSDRQRMTTVHEIEGDRIAFCKGAAEVIIQRCRNIYIHGEYIPMNDGHRQSINYALEGMNEQALRVLAVAGKIIEKNCTCEETMENEMCFLGMWGMIDPPRAEVKAAIAEARAAGIRSVMITGDHITTAKAIGYNLGMGQNALTGNEIEAMSDDELKTKVDNLDIVARATPMVKLRVLRAIRANSHFAVMTGDGVNDSPALKQADVGVAMGIRGTDAAKSAADIVLLDDNYSTIVHAIAEGRRIFDNIRKFVNYLLTCNVGQVITVLLGALFAVQPLTAIMVLAVNVLTDILPAISLGVDPANPGIMQRKPRKHDEHIMDRNLIITTVVIGLKKGVENFVVFLVCYYWLAVDLIGDQRLMYAQTAAFTGVVIYAFVRIAIIRQMDSLSLWSNPWLLISLVMAMIIQLFMIYNNKINAFMGLYELDLRAWGVLGIMAVWAITTGVWTARIIEKREHHKI